MQATFVDTSREAEEMCNEIKPIIEKYGYKNFSIWKAITKDGFNIEIFSNPLVHGTNVQKTTV